MMYDFICTKCEHKFEELVQNKNVKTTKCPECKGKAKYTISAVRTGMYSIQDAAGRREMLKKRSHEDTVKNVRKEPERFGLDGKKPKLPEF